MNFYRIKSKQPKCKTCGKLLREWNPFATEHEHIECASKRLSDSLIEVIKKDFKALRK
jgi:hypothetical protein